MNKAKKGEEQNIDSELEFDMAHEKEKKYECEIT
jgi:hypothetical protein